MPAPITPKNIHRTLSWRDLVMQAAGPEKPVVVYYFRLPKVEVPNHNPFQNL